MFIKIIIAGFGLLSSLGSAANTTCELWTDSQRITHVRAADQASATYCFGYLHGRDRAWQVDYFRRTAYGTNAEVYGFRHLKGDMMMRLLDLPRWAKKLWDALEERERVWIERYSAGLNQGLLAAKKTPSQEFKDGYPWPAEWKPEHTVAVMLLQSFDQTRKTFFSDWEETRALEKWGTIAAQLFDSDGLPWDTTILKKGEYPVNTYPTVKYTPTGEIDRELWGEFPTLLGAESGSNNWVIAPSKSRSGKAMLANDPHLDLKTPMFWYWVHLDVAGEQDVIGASLPGIPLIVSGTNRHVSWGLTNAYLNTADAVRLAAKDASELESFRPVVWVKWLFLKLPIFFKSFERTKDGYPVLPLETKSSAPLVLKWSGFHVRASDVSSIRQLMSVKSATEMEKVLSGVGIPAWNFVFADTSGKIGHRVVGRGLRTTAKPAPGVSEATLEDVRKPEFLSPDEMPHVFNPQRGWIVTANNRHWPADAAFYGGRGYSHGFRATRIEELLGETPKHDLESFQKIQCDSQVVDARYFAPLLVEALEDVDWSVAHRAWLEKLRNWDYSGGLECEVCAVYRRTMDLALEELKVGETGFWRLGEAEDKTWEQAIEVAFKQAFKELEGKRWGEVHFGNFKHLSGEKEWKFSPSIPTKGDKHSVAPGTAKWDEEKGEFDHFSGASQRLVVEMSETPKVWLALPGLNASYDSMDKLKPWQEWADCQQWRVEWPVEWTQKTTEKVVVR